LTRSGQPDCLEGVPVAIEFKLGRQDHKKVEDFLGRRPVGVDAITIDMNHASYQAGAAVGAKAMGIDVLVDPLTERLADIGFEPDGLEYFTPGEPINLNVLHADRAACRQLVRWYSTPSGRSLPSSSRPTSTCTTLRRLDSTSALPAWLSSALRACLSDLSSS
jgi:hypothetical protein